MRHRHPRPERTTTFHRAVYRACDDRLFVAGFDPSGNCRGWFYATEAALPEGVALASLEIRTDDERCEREVLVRFKLDSDTPAARARLVRWAASVGHDRLWFPDDFVDLRAEPMPVVSVGHCDTCESTFREDGADFHEHVRRVGGYPRSCPVCGAPLAVWTPEYLLDGEYDR